MQIHLDLQVFIFKRVVDVFVTGNCFEITFEV